MTLERVKTKWRNQYNHDIDVIIIKCLKSTNFLELDSLYGFNRLFKNLSEKIPKTSKNTLSIHLKKMMEQGIIKRNRIIGRRYTKDRVERRKYERRRYYYDLTQATRVLLDNGIIPTTRPNPLAIAYEKTEDELNFKRKVRSMLNKAARNGSVNKAEDDEKYMKILEKLGALSSSAHDYRFRYKITNFENIVLDVEFLYNQLKNSVNFTLMLSGSRTLYNKLKKWYEWVEGEQAVEVILREVKGAKKKFEKERAKFHEERLRKENPNCKINKDLEKSIGLSIKKDYIELLLNYDKQIDNRMEDFHKNLRKLDSNDFYLIGILLEPTYLGEELLFTKSDFKKTLEEYLT